MRSSEVANFKIFTTLGNLTRPYIFMCKLRNVFKCAFSDSRKYNDETTAEKTFGINSLLDIDQPTTISQMP